MYSVLTLQKRIAVLEQLVLDLKRELDEKNRFVKSKL